MPFLKGSDDMAKIWEFFENLDEFVYVSDMETYEVVYMNRKTREYFGFTSIEEIKGKKCYKLLQNNQARCSMCNNEQLKPGQFVETSYYNPVFGKHMLLKDTMVQDEENGRKYRIEIAMDVDLEVRQGNMLEGYQSMEALVNNGLKFAMQAPTPERSIEVMLEYIGKLLDGERTYVFEKNESGGDDNTYEWVADGITPEKDNLQNLPQEVCAQWYEAFSENKHIIIPDIEEIKDRDPLQYENLKRQDIHSLVVVPLFNEGQVVAFYGIDNPGDKVSFEYASDMLHIMGHFLVSTLKRRDTLKQLQEMSYHDPLTGFGNRFALDAYMEKLDVNNSIGVVFCDITGLKKVNDRRGHLAGDQYIQDACSSIREVFTKEGLFRIGGDEFLILCPKIESLSLREKITALREATKAHNVALAIGSIWRENARVSLDTLLVEAEKLMYKDKAAYYKRTGMDRRR